MGYMCPRIAMNVANIKSESYFKHEVCVSVCVCFFYNLNAWFLRVNFINDNIMSKCHKVAMPGTKGRCPVASASWHCQLPELQC